MSVATGVRAMTSPAIVAATGPKERRTTTQRSATVAIPMSACGRRTLSDPRPRSRTERPMTIVVRGGLSRVMKFAASSEPKNQAVQLCAPAWAAIA